jgi:hypothetical protein
LLRSSVLQRDKERAERATLVEQEKLIKGKVRVHACARVCMWVGLCALRARVRIRTAWTCCHARCHAAITHETCTLLRGAPLWRLCC